MSGLILGIPGAVARRREALAVAFERVLHTLESALGRAVVRQAIQARKEFLRGRSDAPAGFLARIAAVAESIEQVRGGFPPYGFESALQAAFVAGALRTARGAAGVDALVARLRGHDGDQAGFELVAGAFVASRLGDAGAGLLFVPPAKNTRTADAELRLGPDAPDARWVVLECKRQDDRSGPEDRRGRIMQHIDDGVRKIVDKAALAVSIGVITGREPDDPERGEILRSIRRCVQTVRAQAGDSQARDASEVAGGTQVLVRSFRSLGPGACPPMNLGEGDGFDMALLAGSTSNFRLLPRIDDPRPRYTLTMRLGPALGPSGATRRLGEARRQLPGDRPGIVAIWVRDGRQPELGAIVDRVRAELGPGKNTRISAVLLMWLDPAPVLEPPPASLIVRPALLAPNLERALGAEWIVNPHANYPLPALDV